MTKEQSAQQQAQNRSRRTLLLIVAVSVMPLAAAYFMFFTGIGVPASTVNQGILLEQPLSIKDILSAEQWENVQSEKKWRIVVPVDRYCDQECERHLYMTRQVHVRLGEKGPRIERYALNVDGAGGEQVLDAIAAEHPKLKRANVKQSVWQQWADESAVLRELGQHPFFLLVDQEGFAMMAYTEQDGNALLKDIKRALKYSIDFTD